MDMYGEKSRSLPQKAVIIGFEVVFIALSWWLLFHGGGDWAQRHLGIHNAVQGGPRRTVLMLFNITAFLRLGYMMLFLLKRRIPWAESIDIPFAFALYYLGFPLLALPTDLSLDAIDALGIALFLIGSGINTTAEVLRDRWKKEPANKGKLYTGGLFAYSRHINYFGDLLWVSGYAVLTRNGYAALIPAFLFCFFAFYNIPKLETYLRGKYPGFAEYAKRTKRFIPFVY